MWDKVWKDFPFLGNSSPELEETLPLAEASFLLYGRSLPETRPQAHRWMFSAYFHSIA